MPVGVSGKARRLKRPIVEVITARGSVAASSNLTDSGIGKVVDAGAMLYCMYAPDCKSHLG